MVDVLRGFALFGILTINVGAFSHVAGGPPAFFVPIPPVERGLPDVILLLVESKFFTLFSVLFGLSFAIQMTSADRSGAAFVPRFLRRLAALLVFGLLHVLLLWEGDILIIYAVTALALLALRSRSDRALRAGSPACSASP